MTKIQPTGYRSRSGRRRAITDTAPRLTTDSKSGDTSGHLALHQPHRCLSEIYKEICCFEVFLNRLKNSQDQSEHSQRRTFFVEETGTPQTRQKKRAGLGAPTGVFKYELYPQMGRM